MQDINARELQRQAGAPLFVNDKWHATTRDMQRIHNTWHETRNTWHAVLRNSLRKCDQILTAHVHLCARNTHTVTTHKLLTE